MSGVGVSSWPHVPWGISTLEANQPGSGLVQRLALALLFVAAANAAFTYPGTCTDLTAISLLKNAVPDPYKLPPGVEIAYDEVTNTHAYRFTSRARTLSFPTSAILKYCDFFPEEFSILVTLRLDPRSIEQEQCIFSVVPRGLTKYKLGIRLSDKKMYVDYTERLGMRRRQTAFKESSLWDGSWHTVIVTVTADRVSARTDCGQQAVRRIMRTFPSYLNVQQDNIHVGNYNRERRGLFTMVDGMSRHPVPYYLALTDRGAGIMYPLYSLRQIVVGLMKELILLPGSDIARQACPSATPHLPQIPQPPRPLPPETDYAHAQCTWRNTGRLNYDFNSNTLQVCFSGIWQPVLKSQEEKTEKQLDYFVWHQDIVTAAPTIDIEIFRIPGEGLFMATASFDQFDKKLKKQQSAIFKWQNGRFTMYQSLYTLGAQGWEHFQIGRQFFLAVANHGGKRDRPSKSLLYRWSRKQKLFREFQDIITWTARDMEHFQIDGSHFLAIANHVQESLHEIESAIYQWDDNKRRFLHFQNITTSGAYDWTYFRLQDHHFLVVANSLNERPFPTTRLESAIYVWQDGRFLPFQRLETVGATDWEFFLIGNDHYLAVANAVTFGPHTTAQSNRYRTTSIIYRLNAKRDLPLFEIYQNITTYSIVDWEFFTIGNDNYILASNAQQENIIEQDGISLERTRSVLYRWQGIEKFVPVHFLDALPAADWEVFTVDGDTYLAYANAKDSISQVFKVQLR